MTDLVQVLPDFDTQPFTHIIPSLEKSLLTTNDLLTLDATDVARRAQVPPNEVRKLSGELVKQLHMRLGVGDGIRRQSSAKWATISTLDDSLDAALNGGFPTGQLVEVTGESAAGKTQLLLSLLLAVQLPAPRGLDRSALYISTEAPLQTKRLAQILDKHPLLLSLPASERPSLSRIQSTQVHDLESQEHILRYQVPVLLERSNIGLVIVDSVAANFRAEFDHKGSKVKKNGAEALAQRAHQLVQLGALLRHIARTYNVAVITANQVLDRFTAAATAFDFSQGLSQKSALGQLDNASTPTSGRSTSLPGPSIAPLESGPEQQDQAGYMPPLLSTNDPLALDHQQRFFTGWGDTARTTDLKTPSLGLTWTNQLSARVALLKDPILKPQDYLLGPGMDIVGWNRHMKFAFTTWSKDDNGERGTPFEIWEGGIRAKDP